MTAIVDVHHRALVLGSDLEIHAAGAAVVAPASWWLATGIVPWQAQAAEGAADLAASYVDLTGNGNHLIVEVGSVAPVWDAVNGWQFDGAFACLDTLFVPQDDQSQTVIIKFSNVVPWSGNGSIFGVYYSAAGGNGFRMTTNGTAAVGYHNGKSTLAAPQLLSGILAIAGNQGYRNGVAEGGLIAAWTLVPAATCLLGYCRTVGGLPWTSIQHNIQKHVIFDVALTGVQVATMVAAM